MYQPQKTNHHYFLIVFALASLIGWAIVRFYKPLVIETGCSEIASETSDFRLQKKILNPNYSYENVKSRCMESALAEN